MNRHGGGTKFIVIALAVYSVALMASCYIWSQAKSKTNLVGGEETRVLSIGDAQKRLGDLRQGRTYNVPVTITNTRSAALEILNIQTDCGCAVVSAYEHELPGGETHTVNLAITTGRNRGPSRRQCDISYFCPADGNRGHASFSFSGRIVPEFDVNPEIILLRRHVAGHETVVFKRNFDAPFEIQVIGCSSSELSAASRRLGNDSEQVVDVTYQPDSEEFTGPGADILLSTGNPVEPRYRLQVLFR